MGQCFEKYSISLFISFPYKSGLQGLISVLLRYVDLQAFLGRTGLETDLAMILEDIWEVFALHMVSHLSPPIVRED